MSTRSSVTRTLRGVGGSEWVGAGAPSLGGRRGVVRVLWFLTLMGRSLL